MPQSDAPESQPAAQPEVEPAAQPEVQPEPIRRERARDARTGQGAAAHRVSHQTQWVDLQIKRAMERGDFDNLPGKGKPLGDLGPLGDRDWWLKKLIEREQITGVLPAALQLRKDDTGLDALLDAEQVERLVRQHLEEFNRRIIEARRQLQGGPPVVTATRDVEAEVKRWRERRGQRQAHHRSRPEDRAENTARKRSRRRWFGR